MTEFDVYCSTCGKSFIVEGTNQDFLDSITLDPTIKKTYECDECKELDNVVKYARKNR